MEEVHVVFLDQGKFPSVAEHIAILKPGFQPEEELLLGRSELRSETEAEHTVLVTCQAVLVEDATVPIIAFPEVVLLPVVAHFTEEFHRIPVGKENVRNRRLRST